MELNGSVLLSAGCVDPAACCCCNGGIAFEAWICDAILGTAISLDPVRLGYLLATYRPSDIK
jgi:hypothetical protein